MILDTNGLSALVDGDPVLEPILRQAGAVFLPVIVLGEFLFGIKQSRNRLRYEDWLKRRLSSFRLLRVDEFTAEHDATIRLELKGRGKPIPVNDLWIAALTRQHGSRILSRDSHFDYVPGLKRIPW